MSNVHPFPSKKRRYEEASRWISMLDRSLSQEEAEALQAWMSADPENAYMLSSMASLWDRMDALSRLSDLFPVPIHRHRTTPYLWRIAASVLIVAIVSTWFQIGDPGEAAANFEGVYETAIGEKSTVTLSDGTVVVLNTNSLLHVQYTSTSRLLTLDIGEVNVHVAKDESRPLIVAAGAQEFRAVGTAFNVKTIDGSKVELVVTEGKVQVGERKRGSESGPRAEQYVIHEPFPSVKTVSAGEVLIIAPGIPYDAASQVTPGEIEAKLSWRNGNLIFAGEPLEKALQEVSRYTAVQFVFLDDSLRTQAVAGLFRAGDVDGLLVALKQNFDIAYERVGEKTVLLDSQ